jgi:hypothetical protein
MLKLMLEAVDGPSRFYAVPVVRVRAGHRIAEHENQLHVRTEGVDAFGGVRSREVRAGVVSDLLGRRSRFEEGPVPVEISPEVSLVARRTRGGCPSGKEKVRVLNGVVYAKEVRLAVRKVNVLVLPKEVVEGRCRTLHGPPDDEIGQQLRR